MSWRLTDLCGEQVERGGWYGRGVAPCALCELVVLQVSVGVDTVGVCVGGKCAFVRGPLVSAGCAV